MRRPIRLEMPGRPLVQHGELGRGEAQPWISRLLEPGEPPLTDFRGAAMRDDCGKDALALPAAGFAQFSKGREIVTEVDAIRLGSERQQGPPTDPLQRYNPVQESAGCRAGMTVIPAQCAHRYGRPGRTARRTASRQG